jgi:5-methylcytosine-specific restriction enzyme subunit McrC
MPNSQIPQNPTLFTEYGIPIRNLWHMLLYAWDEAPLNAMHGWMMEDAENAPTLDALLASILIRLMQQRLRIGLGHNYVEEERKFPGVRGRINFAESLKQRTLDGGQLICEFQGFSVNASKNQIIRSTLARLLKVGQFGPFDTATPLRATPEAAFVKEVQQKLRRLIRDLDGIDFIELTPDLIRRQLLVRHDHDYRLMLSICDLIVQRQMPSGSEGTSLAVPAFDREALVLHNIYERFVANFYRIHLAGWNVSAQKRLEWHAKETSERLPMMVPDLVLQEGSSNQIIILDTKFTAHSLIENQWGKPIYDSSHLYQLYAYLKSQEQLSEAHRNAMGMLLYPAVQSKLSEKIELQDHTIRIESIDLAAPWQEIERQLIELVASAS